MRNDLRYALRILLRERGFAAAVVLSLAVGIGANTAIFSVVNGVLLRPLPYRDAERLFTVREVVPKIARMYPTLPVNLNHYLEWRKRCSALESIAILDLSAANLTGVGDPELLTSAWVSANALHLLGIGPQLGRSFLVEEESEGRDKVVILADSLWRRRFDSQPDIIGRKIVLDGTPNLVVGVLPAGFQFPGMHDQPEVLKPLGYSKDDLEEIEGDFNHSVIARLQPGVPQQKALAELNVIQAEISQRMPEKMDMHVAMTPLHEEITAHVQRGLLVLLGAVGAVLLILCVNLANLSLARAAGRAREAAIRTALGAGRAQLVRQTLTESMLLALIGGGLGIGLAWFGVDVLLGAAPADLPLLNAVRIDLRVLSFALLISLATGFAFGILPALRSARSQPQAALKSGSYTVTEGSRGVRVRDLLVTAEAALSAMLLITAGLLVASFVRLLHVDKGFNIDRVLAIRLSLPSTKYTEKEQMAAFFERVLEGARTLPGVVSASFVSALPLQGETWMDLVAPENDPRPLFERPMANVRFVTPDYFATLRIAFREGRTFDDSQRRRKVAIISQGTARRLWPGQNVLGRHMLHNEEIVEVVGVTADIRSTSLDKEPVPIIYLPDWQRPRLGASLLVRTAMDPRGVAAALREVIRRVDRDVPVPQMRTMEQVMSDSVAERRFEMLLVMLFAAAALALAGFGIYGVVSYSVARRRQEMGIRMALGAGAARLERMVVWHAIRPVMVGLAVGILAALAAGRILGSLLFQVSTRDPVIIAAVALVLLLVSAGAALPPARRGTRVDPMSALRFE